MNDPQNYLVIDGSRLTNSFVVYLRDLRSARVEIHQCLRFTNLVFHWTIYKEKMLKSNLMKEVGESQPRYFTCECNNDSKPDQECSCQVSTA